MAFLRHLDVLFNSTLERTEDGTPNPRLIGRTSLPWHRVNGDPFGGPGWLGRKQRRERTNQHYAASLRGAEAARVAGGLHLKRKNGKSGTSILVVGFREPAEEDRSSLKEIADGIAEAASRWFWPSLIGREPSLKVEISIQENEEETFSEAVDAGKHEVVKPFIEAYRVWQKEDDIEDPSYPGDVAAVPITVHLPAERDRRGMSDPHSEMEAEAMLVVRMAGDEERKRTHANEVAYFRGAGMVVQYRTLRRLAISAKDYHAALICGTAKGNYERDEALERFLRAAEPPEHDTWDSTANLKKAYKKGYKKAIDDMDAEVRRQLHRLVTETTKTGAQGPDLFRKKFPIGNTGGGGGERSFVDLQDLTAYVEENGTMRFKGRLRARSRSPKVWEAGLDIRIAEEDKRGDVAKVRDFATNQNGEVKVYRPKDGEGELRLLVNKGTRAVDFSGSIDLRGAVADPGLSSIDVKAVGHELDG